MQKVKKVVKKYKYWNSKKKNYTKLFIEAAHYPGIKVCWRKNKPEGWHLLWSDPQSSEDCIWNIKRFDLYCI